MDYNSDIYDNPRDELVSVVNDELSVIKSSLEEIKAQIDQQQMMVNREQQNYSDLAAEIRNMEHNIDTVPRGDIKDKYNEALTVNQRLLTMRGQLEKFQSNYDRLQHDRTVLSQVMGLVQGVEFVDDSESEVDSNATKGGLNVVRIVQAQEDERQRLARQMHDGPAQSLTNFILQTEICQRLFSRNPERAAEELDNLKTAASVTFQKVRDFIFDLRPMMLDDLGVVPTVRRYVTSFSEKNDIKVTLDITGEERRLENHREVLIFRGVQELMSFARDYANPTELTVRIDMGPSQIKITSKDNGKGFDSDLVMGEHPPESHTDPRVPGLFTLREKYELVGGSVLIDSTEGDGTTVIIQLPSGE